jgi:pimeloyl-ACP methyl ester carboxylesterase
MASNRYALPAVREEPPAASIAYALVRGLAPARKRRSRLAQPLLAVAATLAGAALYVNRRTRTAERELPPAGRFVDVGGTRLHYIARGEGPTVVVLHGNGSRTDELDSSGLVDLLAQHYRVVAFDRPGFGHSDRPGDVEWSAPAQASLLALALAKLGIGRATLVGHASGALTAIALALDHPQHVRGLVLASGAYFRPSRLLAFMLSSPAWPVVGPLTRYTSSPLAGRTAWAALLRVAFGPSPTPPRFRQLSAWSFLKPSRLVALASESRSLARDARRLQPRYRDIRVPTVILAGAADRVTRRGREARRLHDTIAGSALHVVPGVGHMLHHAVPGRVLRAVDDIALADARGAGPAEEMCVSPSVRELLADVPARGYAVARTRDAAPAKRGRTR